MWTPYAEERRELLDLQLAEQLHDAVFVDDPFFSDDGEELVCGIENPDYCESCQ